MARDFLFPTNVLKHLQYSIKMYKASVSSVIIIFSSPESVSNQSWCCVILCDVLTNLICQHWPPNNVISEEIKYVSYKIHVYWLASRYWIDICMIHVDWIRRHIEKIFPELLYFMRKHFKALLWINYHVSFHFINDFYRNCEILMFKVWVNIFPFISCIGAQNISTFHQVIICTMTGHFCPIRSILHSP